LTLDAGEWLQRTVVARKLEKELGWRAQETFATGLRKTVQWYLNNKAWMDEVTSSSYQKWVHANYGHRWEAKNAVVVPAGAL
jgi:dTDP-D-glucose 4,6-dehydratase